MFTPKELVLLIVLMVALWAAAILFTGCSTSSQKVSSQVPASPPLPVGVQSPQMGVSHAAAVVGPPQPVLLSLSWPGGSITNADFPAPLPACYRVEVSRDMVTWSLLTNVVAPGPDYSVQTLATGTNYFRVREAQPWEVSP